MAGVHRLEHIQRFSSAALTDHYPIRPHAQGIDHQPEFLKWWEELGPKDFQAADVYLRTATSVDAKGWATYGYVRMPDYRWGIFLNDRDPNRRIGFGDNFGQEVWQQIPGEYRATLRRLIVTQGDTEPASVEI